MLENDKIQKMIEVFDRTIQNEIAQNVLNKYINYLQITYEQAKYLITHNISACNWFSMADATMTLCTEEYFIKILIKVTIFREIDKHIFEPLTNKEIEVLKEYNLILKR